MNTVTRRFILRLIVGLLTFLIGVAAAIALGGFRPFQSLTGSPNYIYRRGAYYSPRAEPAFEYYEYHEHGCKMRSRGLPPPPPPLADAPLPPSPPRALR
ncbi:MAG TPA: hypothetical protein VEV81_05380 [Pyrinomonadaceae bacterium]|nr:hypothetical protein [Pyrinomonadaceae bacterium]